MATILNIETTGRICSVALCVDGAVEYQLEDTEGMRHAERLAPFVEKALATLRRRGQKLDAVAVSAGPGSYTGLRIGLSTAKGLCFGLDVPLLMVPTLEVLAAKTMFLNRPFTGEELLMPMVDARRMEVFTGIYDFALQEVQAPGPLVLDSTELPQLPTGRPLLVMGTGAEKAAVLAERYPNMEIIGLMEPHARDMMPLSERLWRLQRFADTAYSTPLYLKEYHFATPRKNEPASAN